MVKYSDMEVGSFTPESGIENCHSLIVAQVVFRSPLLSNPEGLTCGSGNCSSSITRELVRNANSLPHPRPTESENLGMGPSNLCFNTHNRRL